MKVYECLKCGRAFLSKRSLGIHQGCKNHWGGILISDYDSAAYPHLCPHCGFQARSVMGLRIHVRKCKKKGLTSAN